MHNLAKILKGENQNISVFATPPPNLFSLVFFSVWKRQDV